MIIYKMFTIVTRRLKRHSEPVSIIQEPVLCYESSYCDMFMKSDSAFGSGSGSATELPQLMNLFDCCMGNPRYSSKTMTNGRNICISCKGIKCYESSRYCDGDEYSQLPKNTPPNHCCKTNKSVLVRVVGTVEEYVCVPCNLESK